jgi:hypothetical protein
MPRDGYSHRSVAEKLGLKPGMDIVILNAPENYFSLLTLPDKVTVDSSLGSNKDIVQCFLTTKKECEKLFLRLPKSIKKNGSVWIAWPKGSSNIPTDLNENIIREIGLKNGMVDVKVIALDSNWSGLKFVYRIKDRGI